MKRTFLTFMLLALGWSAGAQQAPNYEAAARFSTKKISQMVHSTTITPAWFQNSDKFWYSWKSPEGTHYYIVDPTTGTKTEVFDMEKLAMEITSIVHDPFDAQHIPMQSLELKDDKAFRFDIRSTKDVPDTTAAAKKGPKKMTKKVYHFEYDIASGKLSEYKPEEKKYPRWASISPDGKTGVFMKNSNLSGWTRRTWPRPQRMRRILQSSSISLPVTELRTLVLVAATEKVPTQPDVQWQV